MPTVFISYRHESDAHRERVRELAVRLRDGEGLDVIFDGFEEVKHGGMAPPNGWPLWSIQQANADHVIIVASSGWFRVFNKPDPSPKNGRGAAAEAECIGTRMYKAGGNTFAVMTYFDQVADLVDLPPFLEKCSRLNAARDEDVSRIVNWVQGRGPMPVQTPITPAIPWPTDVLFPKGALADRHDHCRLFASMLTGVAPESVVCIIAGSGTGKSRLLKVFQEVASSALAGRGQVAYVKNLQEKTIDGLVDDLCKTFGGYPKFPRYEASVSHDQSAKAQHIAFFADLRIRPSPTLLILDAWEKASEELREWVTGHLVPVVVAAPALKLVIAGQPSAAFPTPEPGAVECLPLSNIERDDWHRFVEDRYTAEADKLKLVIDHCVDKAHGVKAIADILEIMEKGVLTA